MLKWMHTLATTTTSIRIHKRIFHAGQNILPKLIRQHVSRLRERGTHDGSRVGNGHVQAFPGSEIIGPRRGGRSGAAANTTTQRQYSLYRRGAHRFVLGWSRALGNGIHACATLCRRATRELPNEPSIARIGEVVRIVGCSGVEKHHTYMHAKGSGHRCSSGRGLVLVSWVEGCSETSTSKLVLLVPTHLLNLVCYRYANRVLFY